MYDTPLVRPTTVGGLLAAPFRGTGQVAQAGGGVPLQNYLLGPRSLDMLAARRTSTPATTMVAPSPVGLLTPEMMSTQAPAGFDYVAPAPQLTRDQETRYSNYLLDNKVRDRLSKGSGDEPTRSPKPEEVRRGFLGRIAEGVRGAGRELGGLFEGDEGRARAAALSRSLLRGPSRTPISFGQSVAEGLAEGGAEIERQAVRKAKMEQLERSSKRQKQKDEALDVLAKKDATSKEVMDALRVIDPSAYAKALSKDKSFSQVKADFLMNLKSENPAEYQRLVTKSIEGNVDILTALLGGDVEGGAVAAKTPAQQAQEEINKRKAAKS